MRISHRWWSDKRCLRIAPVINDAGSGKSLRAFGGGEEQGILAVVIPVRSKNSVFIINITHPFVFAVAVEFLFGFMSAHRAIRLVPIAAFCLG